MCDTNVLLSALIFPGGSPEQVIELCRTGELSHFTSPDILSEFRGVLTRKFRYGASDAEEFCERVLAFSELVYPTQRLRVVTRKDSDNRVIECAVTANAEFIITGDRRDLLPLRSYGDVQIVTAADLLRRLAE